MDIFTLIVGFILLVFIGITIWFIVQPDEHEVHSDRKDSEYINKLWDGECYCAYKCLGCNPKSVKCKKLPK